MQHLKTLKRWNKKERKLSTWDIECYIRHDLIILFLFLLYPCTKSVYIPVHRLPVKRSPDTCIFQCRKEHCPSCFPPKSYDQLYQLYVLVDYYIWPIVFGKYHISIRDFIVSQIKAAHSILDRWRSDVLTFWRSWNCCCSSSWVPSPSSPTIIDALHDACICLLWSNPAVLLHCVNQFALNTFRLQRAPTVPSFQKKQRRPKHDDNIKSYRISPKRLLAPSPSSSCTKLESKATTNCNNHAECQYFECIALRVSSLYAVVQQMFKCRPQRHRWQCCRQCRWQCRRQCRRQCHRQYRHQYQRGVSPATYVGANDFQPTTWNITCPTYHQLHQPTPHTLPWGYDLWTDDQPAIMAQHSHGDPWGNSVFVVKRNQTVRQFSNWVIFYPDT